MFFSSLDSVLLAFASLALPPFHHAQRSIEKNYSMGTNDYSVRCERIKCSHSPSVCPPWHYCNTRTRLCSPCSRCRDGADVLPVPPANCRDHQFCIDPFGSRQDYACPWLRVDPDFPCSGVCSPCGGPFGYFLGTKCRVQCEDGDAEVFDCVFVNERAQWNIARRPRWIQYVNFTPTNATVPAQLTYSSSSTVAFSVREESRNPTHSVGVVVAVIVGALIAGTVIVFAVVWSLRRRRRRRPPHPIKASACTERPTGCCALGRAAVEYSLADLTARPSLSMHRWSSRDDGSISRTHRDECVLVETRKIPVENEAESTGDDSGYSARRFGWGSLDSVFFGVASNSTDSQLIN